MRDTMNSIIENNKFTLTTPVEGRNSAGRALEYTVNKGSDGARTYKAR